MNSRQIEIYKGLLEVAGRTNLPHSCVLHISEGINLLDEQNKRIEALERKVKDYELFIEQLNAPEA